MAKPALSGKMRSGKKRRLDIAHSWAGPEQPPIDALLNKFERKHRDIRTARNVLEWSIYMFTMKEKMIRGIPPDVLSLEVGQRLVQFAKAGYLTDLSHIWEEEGFFDAFPDWLRESCTVDGKIYGIPTKRYTFAVWYLTEIFKEYKVKPPKTWAEFVNACSTFKEAGIVPIISGGWGTMLWFKHLLARTVGVETYNKLMNGKKSWADRKVVNTYDMLRKFAKKYFYPHPFGYTSMIAWMKLNRGVAAMQLQGDWVGGMWGREFGYKPGKEFNYFLLPPLNSGGEQVMTMGGNAWVMPRNAPNSEDADKFLRYAGSLEAQKILTKKGMGLPARDDVPKKIYDPLLTRLYKETLKYPIVLEMGCALPPKLVEIEEFNRMRILFDSMLKKEIEIICAEIATAIREHFESEEATLKMYARGKK